MLVVPGKPDADLLPNNISVVEVHYDPGKII